MLEQSLITKYLNLDNTTTSSTKGGGKRLSAIRTPRNAVQAAYSRDAMAKSVYQVSSITAYTVYYPTICRRDHVSNKMTIVSI